MEQFSCQRGSVSVSDVTLHYTVEGSGIPILVIGSATYYPRIFSWRLREFCTLAFADLRIFTESDAELNLERLTFDTYTDDIEHIRLALGFEQVVIVGHSHIGNLALEYAKRYPERVSHVVMICSPPCGVKRTIEASEDYWETHAAEDRKAILRHNWKAISDKLASMSSDEAFIAQYAADGPKLWYNHNYDSSPLWRNMHINMDVIKALRGLFTDEYKLSWDSAHLKAKVLVVMGRYDYVVPHVLWDEVLPNLQNVTYHLFERSGHTPQLEEQKLFDQLLLEWLEKG
jgi:proline iminopeptidase